MASSSSRRLARGAMPLLAIAALVLAGCTNSQEDSTATVTPFSTVKAAPEGTGGGHGEGAAGGHGEAEGGEAGHDKAEGHDGAMGHDEAEGHDEGEKSGGKRAELKGKDGKSVGTVTFAEDGDAVKVTVKLTGLPAGPHEVHVHESGTCTAPTFASAGPHLGVPSGADRGALPTIVALKSGAADATSEVDTFTLDELTTGDGTSVVVHGPNGADDRIACGKVE